MRNIVKPFRFVIGATFAACAAVLVASCDINGGTSIVSEIDFSGEYVGDNSGSAVASPANSGALVTRFNLTQSGKQLTAVDNAGGSWAGALDKVADNTDTESKFTLKGGTTAGQPVTIEGSLKKNSSTATMSGTWSEPGLKASVRATATIGSLTITPVNPFVTAGYTLLLSANDSATEHATIKWGLSSSALGKLSVTTGYQTLFESNGSDGTVQITATDQDHNTAAATITVGGIFISPTNATIAVNSSVTLSARDTISGASIRWSLNKTKYGHLNATNGAQVVFTSTAAGQTIVTASDNNGLSTSTIVTGK